MTNIDRAAKVILNHRGGTWSTSVETAHALAEAGLLTPDLPDESWPQVWGPNPGKWTRGFNQDAIVSVADPSASKAFGER